MPEDKYSHTRKPRENKVVRENHLDFLQDLYYKGINLDPEQLRLLRQHERIPQLDTGIKKEEKNPLKDEVNLSEKSSADQRENDANIDILHDDGGSLDEIITDADLEERRRAGGYVFEGRTDPIQRSEWMPKSIMEHEPDFIEWIDSMLSHGWSKRLQYRKFNLYVQQAYTWLSEKQKYEFNDQYEREEYEINELKRCSENTLYFLNKYVYYQEGDASSGDGKVKYIALPAHELMVFLNDSGYSMAILKCRQMAATTTLMSCDVKDMIFKKNHFMKFITEDEQKAQEIFEDKLKFAFSELPPWMKPHVLNERDNYFRLGNKEEKGDKGGVQSRILVVAPKRTAIAGGAPQKVKIDEAGNIPLLTSMLNNARPTRLVYDPKDKKLKVRRQVIFWGTAGEMNKGGDVFESEFMTLVNQWKERKFGAYIIPVFFDFWARPGITQEIYDNEKELAYSAMGPDRKKTIIEFHQSYPASIQDAFMSSDKTLVDTDYINQQLAKITEVKVKKDFQLIQSGFFEPIYDYTTPADENSDVPYKIIGATFVPTADIDPRKCVEIFLHPEKGWVKRYYHGNDPIASDNGQSNMAGAIYDKHFKTIAAIMDFRTKDYRYVFMQQMLLGLYYDTQEAPKGVKELVECNIGQSYTQYKEAKGFGDSLVGNFELPPYFQTKSNSTTLGIDNRGNRNAGIINRLHEFIKSYGENVYIEEFWKQLKTFTCELSEKSGKEVWGPSNRKYYKDDILFAVVYAYICGELCYSEEIPENKQQQKLSYVIRYETRYDQNWNLVRVPVKKFTNGRAHE